MEHLHVALLCPPPHDRRQRHLGAGESPQPAPAVSPPPGSRPKPRQPPIASCVYFGTPALSVAAAAAAAAAAAQTSLCADTWRGVGGSLTGSAHAHVVAVTRGVPAVGWRRWPRLQALLVMYTAYYLSLDAFTGGLFSLVLALFYVQVLTAC